MAEDTLSFEGMDELIRRMEKADILDDDTLGEMLFSGADDMVASINEAMDKSRFSLADYKGCVSYTRKVKRDKQKVPYVVVSPRGKNRHGVSRGVVLFVLNYGRHKRKGYFYGDFFWTIAKQRSQTNFIKICEDIATEKLKERGLI